MNAFKLFLQQHRFDLIYKYLYVKHPNNDYIKYAYLENIRAFNQFYEVSPSDHQPKNCADDFIKSFDNLIKSIKSNGYLMNMDKVPIGKNGEITDGAHRLAICACYNINVCTTTEDREDLYDYKFFNNNLMSPEVMDFGALEYVKLNSNAYIVNLHSITDPKLDDIVTKILEKYGFIYYKKNINLSYNGYVNLKRLSYGSFWEQEKWIGDTNNKFEGAQNHALQSIGNFPLRVFVFVCNDFQNVLKAKAEIRALYKIGNFSVHINDTHEEAQWLSEIYFNKNSLFVLNSRCFYFEDKNFDKLIELLKNTAKEHNVSLEDLCAAGSTPMNVVGLRQSSDLDFLYCGNKEFNIQTDFLSNHDSELDYYPYNKKSIIQNPKYHFYYHGLKFITLEILLKMKQARNENPKDINDSKLIKNYLRKNNKDQFKFYKKIKNGKKRTIILFNKIKFSYYR